MADLSVRLRVVQYNNQQGDGLEEIRRRMAHKEEIFRQQRVRICSELEAQGSFASANIAKRVSSAAAEISGGFSRAIASVPFMIAKR